tara:strand:- start:4047 stop:5234 length:1188 start_codon:yes stop_codon:yes gene_type:complete
MNFEIWWLFGIPFFFSLGWIAARIDINSVISESKTLSKNYYQGLNAILDEKYDRAIEYFVEISREDPETAELHFALGNLFRRRGDIEKAVRVHQNLLSRHDLSRENNSKAKYELGQDYLKAGLLDRAEETFNQLNGTFYDSQARRALLEIYQREKEWSRAIDAAVFLKNSGVGAYQKEIAQFYCELAQDELVHSSSENALITLEKALFFDRNNVRAQILIGDLLFSKNDHEGALKVWRKVEQQSTHHVALVAQRLMDGYQRVGRIREGINLLNSYLDQSPSVDLLDVVFKAVLELDGQKAAYQLVIKELKRTPTLLGLDKLIEVRLTYKSVSPEELVELSMIKTLIGNYAQKSARYRCSHCGFQAKQFYWHCPGCSQWESYAPRRTEELFLMIQK